MKKIININFHGRVVPIEETAYEILQQYIKSLRTYFANEEGRDEIIDDIENRFAELFSESLKKGSTCITDPDVNAIIASMGRPEDFEQEAMSGASEPASNNRGSQGGGTGTGTGAGTSPGSSTGAGQQGSYSQQGSSSYAEDEHRRLYRSGNDKILGGVCAGLANYFKIDPSLVRILFVLLMFGGGAGFLLYIILWVVLPTRSLPVNARKRLFRNNDDRVIGGVAGGLAAYFHIEVWIPRLIFALPLIAGLLTSIFHRIWWFGYHDSIFYTGGFGGSILITYIVLWIVLPEASTASEKLEMRGEKVDLESIKNTIKSDLESFKGRAKDMGDEMKDRFQKVGEEMKQGTRNFATETAPIARSAGQGIGHAIGVLFRVFFLFIACVIVFALIMAAIGLLFSGAGILNLKGYIINGTWPNVLVWASFLLFLIVPIIALLTWLIRRITRTRSRGHYLGYIFASLWVIGLFCFIALAGTVLNDFRYREHVEEEAPLSQPAHGKLLIRAAGTEKGFYRFEDDDFDFRWDRHAFFYELNEDSMNLKTVRVVLMKSADSNYHVQLVKFSRGNDPHLAAQLASQINFPIRQTDSVLYLPDGFTVSRYQQFRNQQVMVAVSIPVGKRILVDGNIDNYDWFTIDVNRHHLSWNIHDRDHWNGGWDEDNDQQGFWGNSFPWTSNKEYIMTSDGLTRTDKKAVEKEDQEENSAPRQKEGGSYRYKSHKDQDSLRIRHNKDTTGGKSTTMVMDGDQSVCLLTSMFDLN